MMPPFSIFQNVDDIQPYLESEDRVVYPICDKIIFVSQKCLDPLEDDYIAFDSNLATIVGLFHKQVLLFSDLYESYKEEKMHLCVILQRVIYEAYIKMLYLIRHKDEAQISYRRYSYKARKEFLDNNPHNSNGYFKVRNDKFLQDLADDGFDLNDLTQQKKSFDGKKFKQLMEEFEGNELYTSLYGIASDPIHSDWGDIRQLYLKKTPDNKYVAMVDNTTKGHYRYLIPNAVLLIDSCKAYINWEEGYPQNKYFLPLMDELRRVCELIMKSVFNDYQNNPDKYMQE